MRDLVSLLTWSANDPGRLLRALATLIIALSLSVVWLDARNNHYVPCAENCGESFLVFKYVQDYRLYGLKHGLLEDRATTPDADRRPYLYTHNANLPGVVYALLDVLGLRALWQKQLVILGIHGLGLALVFVTVSRLSGSVGLGLATVAFFCLDYSLVFNFAMNPLRAWHWLALFGLLYHAVRVAEDREWRHVSTLGLVLFGGVAFGLGYEFFAICATIALLATSLWMPRPLWSRNSARVLGQLCAALLVPIALRQAQVLFVLGPEFWIRDIGYSLMKKIPALRDVVGHVSNEDVARYYLSLGVVHFDPPEAIPFREFWVHLTELNRFVLLPTAGLLTLVVTGMICVGSALYLALRSIPSVRARLECRLGFEGEATSAAMSRLVAATAGGTFIGMAIFPYHNVQIFVKHLVPLLAAPLFVSKGVFVVLAFIVMRKSRRFGVQALACVALTAVILDHLVVQVANIRSKTPYNMEWIPEVESRGDAVFAVSWQPAAVSVFTRQDAVSLSPAQQAALLARVQNGRSPVEQATDVTHASTVPGDGTGTTRKPDYWLYFPTDNMSPFDHPTPSCRQDYLTAAVARITRQKSHGPPKVFNEWIRPATATVRPGDYVVFGGRVENTGRRLPDLRLSTEKEFEHELAINCQRSIYMGWVKTSLDSSGEYAVSVVPWESHGAIPARVHFRIAPEAPPPGFSFPSEAEKVGLPMPWPMPSADRLAAEHPELPIAARGSGWVLFDLRPLYREPRRLLGPSPAN